MYTPDQTRKTIQRALSPQEQLSRDKLRRVILLSNVGVAGGGAAGWTPARLSSIGAWWGSASKVGYYTDAAKTTSVTADGQAVYTIADRGPSGYDQIQATLGARPIAKLVSGKWYLRFDGVSTVTTTAASVLQTNTVGVYGVLATSTANKIPWGHKGATSSTGRYPHSGYLGTGKWRPEFDTGSPTNSSSTSTITDGTLRSVGYEFDGTNGVGYISRTADPVSFAVTPGNLLYDADSTFWLGARIDNFFFNGDLAEVVVTTAPLSGANRTLLWDYFTAQWGVS